MIKSKKIENKTICISIFCHSIIRRKSAAMWFSVFLCLMLLFCYGFTKYFDRKNLPPGPLCLPIVGSIFSIYLHVKKVNYQHVVWQNWKKKYGNIFRLKLGFTNVIVISGKELIEEVSNRDIFNGRPSGVFYLVRSLGKKTGVVFSEGPNWLNTRRLLLKCLKKNGLGTQTMETMIAEECKALVDLRLTDAGKAINMNQMFDVSLLNVLWRMVCSKRYELNDRRLKNLCFLIRRAFKIMDMSGGIINVMPFLRHVIPSKIGYNELVDIYKILYKYLREIVKHHEQTVDVNKPRDVIDLFLIEFINQRNNNYDDLLVVCLDLFEAGLETVSNTLEFLMLYLIKYEEIQTKVQNEIDEIIGPKRSPIILDKKKMVYTEAVLLEAMRMSSVAPIGIPHKALSDAELSNYFISKDSSIFLNLYDLHLGSHWEDPLEFRPTRFISNGKLINHECLIPFGTGKRRCIGEGLARSELFLFLTHLLQKFSLRLPEGDPLPSTEPVNGVSLSPKPFSVVFLPR